jgi:CelD/BcsL family acetyltransferase involved in cellulose biosynthesis
MGATARIVEDVDGLTPLRAQWDELAVAAGRPFSAPGWVLAWWQHMRPNGARLQVLVVEREGDLVGVVPLYGADRVTRSIGAELAPVEPLSRAGLETEVIAAASDLLATIEPRVRLIELVEHGSGPAWAELLSRAWPGGRGAWQLVESEAPAPQVDFGEGLDAWMMSKSKSFRRDIRSSRRKLEESGATFRLASEETIESDVREFLRLHRLRLADRGGTSIPPGEGIERMLVTAGRELLPSERFRLLCLDLDGEVIAADLLLAAGPEMSAWNSGFDEAHRDLSPIMQCLVHALTDSAERGERSMNLGPGGQDYKYRLSTSEDCLRSSMIVPRGASYPLVRLRLLPRQARRALAGRLSPDAKRRLRRLGVS